MNNSFTLCFPNIIKPVDYVKNGDNIEITTKSLGKYVVSYKELKTVSPEVTLPIITDNKRNNLMWIIASVGVILFGFAIYVVKKPKKN